MLAAFIGLMLPNYALDQLVERRRSACATRSRTRWTCSWFASRPGWASTAAIQRVGEELRFSHPDLGAEFELVTAEMRAGVEREAALKGLAARTGLEDIRGLVQTCSCRP